MGRVERVFTTDRAEARARRAIEQYYAIRKTRGVAFSPEASQVAFVTNTTGTGEIWRLGAQGGWPHQVTIGGRNVAELTWSPRGDRLVFTADRDGDENYEVFAISSSGGLATALAPSPGRQAHLGGWSPDGKTIVYASNKRHPAYFDLYLCDVDSGAERPLWQDDHVNMALSWSDCGRYVVAQRFEQNANQDLFLVEVDSGTACLLTPHEGLVRHFGAAWEPDSSGFYFLTDNGRDFLGLARMAIPEGTWEYVETPDADVVEVATSRDGRWRAVAVNRDGNFVPELQDLATGQRVALPDFARGVASELKFSPNSRRLALYHESPSRARDLWIVDLPEAPVSEISAASGTVQSVRQVTFSMFGGLGPEDLCMPESVHFTSFDGLEISALLFVPKGARPDGTLGAVLWPHGGPDAQVIQNFYHWFQVFAGAGYVVLAPNFRGSTGYGKAFQLLNRQDWGGASFRDLVAGADFLLRSRWADPRRLAVVGGSFGGFMSLTAATQEPDRWAAVVDFFGPSNLHTFIESTPAWWKPYLYDMVGHPERDRERLSERSPVNFLDRVVAPLLVIQGAHDPRVTKAESDQVVERLRALGRPVEYMVFEDEGHGFSRTSNEIRAAGAIVDFLDRHLAAE